ncbi:MAG: response regulator [Thermodesulfobacteriota bacterium]
MKEKTILCVDDDPGMHALLHEQLELSGYLSHHAIHGNEAIEKLGRGNIDLVLLDINMPGMDGFKVLDYIKDQKEIKHIPVIFVSSLNREHLKVKGFESGADDFIVKPFTGPELLARIKAVLRRTEKLRPKEEAAQGNVNDLGLFELLHMLSFSGNSYLVTFPEMNGKLVIDNGHIYSMEQGTFTGKDALLRLFLLADGTFSILNKPPLTEDPESGINIESLILYVASQIDEIEEKLEIAGVVDLPLNLKPGSSDFSDILSFEKQFPLTAKQLIVKMDGDIAANTDRVVAALGAGLLSS